MRFLVVRTRALCAFEASASREPRACVLHTRRTTNLARAYSGTHAPDSLISVFFLYPLVLGLVAGRDTMKVFEIAKKVRDAKEDSISEE